ncbi:hypothetical protein [Rhodococcus zopfii]|uniref:hypothetical protein n=1 Tax=Rhodococcus zopfii TaxID=43772 RepID=UPI000B099C03|nr:hypothetical protein [Rhodococcus zopfii]
MTWSTVLFIGAMSLGFWRMAFQPKISRTTGMSFAVWETHDIVRVINAAVPCVGVCEPVASSQDQREHLRECGRKLVPAKT